MYIEKPASLARIKCTTLLFCIFVAVFTGCHRQPIPITPLYAGAEKVTFGTNAPPDNYEQIGPVSAVDGIGCGLYGSRGTYLSATADLRNRAFNMDADYVHILTMTEPRLMGECFVNTYTINGTAYRRVRESPSAIPISVKDTEAPKGLRDQLRELNDLKQEGLLSEDEFKEQRAKVLKAK